MTAQPIDWGYLLRFAKNGLVEIRSRDMGASIVLAFWLHSHKPVDRNSMLAAYRRFLKDFVGLIDANLGLFEERRDVPERSSYALSNIAAQRYGSAEKLLKLARSIDTRSIRRQLKAEEELDPVGPGYLYAAAAATFFMALEAFVNTVYHLLLKEEYRNEAYSRVIIRSDFDFRIATLHLFCRGFRKQAIAPKSPLWKKLKRLVAFRNEYVHGSISDDFRVYALTEDHFPMYYSPTFDFRGRELQRKKEEALPQFQTKIDEKVVMEIKQAVDEVREAIVSALDSKRRDWVQDWMSNALIQPEA